MASTQSTPSGIGFLFRPKWLGFHLLCLAAVVGMVLAGFWQLRRLDERRTANADFVAQVNQPAVLLDELRSAIETDADSVVNRRVIVSGTYATEQIVLFNRSQGGRAVDNVLTPLIVDDGSVMIVNRGAIGVSVPPPPPPAVSIEIEGRLRASESRERGALTDATQPVLTEIRRVDLDQIGQLDLGGDVLPMYVELLASRPEVGPGDPQLLDPPELSEGNHLSYAFQWFIFSACVAAGWVLAVRRSLRTDRLKSARTSDETPGAAAPGTRPPKT